MIDQIDGAQSGCLIDDGYTKYETENNFHVHLTSALKCFKLVLETKSGRIVRTWLNDAHSTQIIYHWATGYLLS